MQPAASRASRAIPLLAMSVVVVIKLIPLNRDKLRSGASENYDGALWKCIVSEYDIAYNGE